MKKYISFFRIRFANGLQYRAAAFAGIATQFAWGGLTLIMFSAFYRSGKQAFPMTFFQLSSYIWLQQAFLGMFMSWFFDNDIFNSITNGNISYELCRPADLYSMWFIKSMAVRLSNTFLRCLPILAVAVFLPHPFNMSLPSSSLSGILFFASLFLGFLVLIAFSMLIYISAFYTISSTGVKILAVSLLEFLSGAVIPLPFFPDKIRFIISLLPFASMQNTPLLIYISNIKGASIIFDLLLQIFWLSVLVLTGKLLIRNALKKVVVQGG